MEAQPTGRISQNREKNWVSAGNKATGREYRLAWLPLWKIDWQRMDGTTGP